MPNVEDIALFDRYLEGNMSGAERNHFEGRIESDETLRRSFDEYMIIVRGIELGGRSILKSRFDSIEQGISPDEILDYKPGIPKNISKADKRWNYMTWVMLIGSAILLVAFVIAITNLPDLEEKLRGKRQPTVVIEEEIEEPLNCSQMAVWQDPSASEPAQTEDVVILCHTISDSMWSELIQVKMDLDTIRYYGPEYDILRVIYKSDSEYVLEVDGILNHVSNGETLAQETSVQSSIENYPQSIQELPETNDSNIYAPVKKIKIHHESPSRTTTGNISGKQQEFAFVYGYSHVEIKPKFEQESLSTWINVQVGALSQNLSKYSGVAEIVVLKTGEVNQAKILPKVGSDEMYQVLRALWKMPDWKPAMQGDSPVNVYLYLDISSKNDSIILEIIDGEYVGKIPQSAEINEEYLRID